MEGRRAFHLSSCSMASQLKASYRLMLPPLHRASLLTLSPTTTGFFRLPSMASPRTMRLAGRPSRSEVKTVCLYTPDMVRYRSVPAAFILGPCVGGNCQKYGCWRCLLSSSTRSVVFVQRILSRQTAKVILREHAAVLQTSRLEMQRL